MKNTPFVIERTFNAPVQKVWKAITDKEQMKEWYFDLEEFKPEPGFEFQFVGGKEDKPYLHLCKITEVVVGKKLTYSWRYDGYEGNSFVSFELFAEGDKTRLKLTHTGLETFPANNPDLAAENFATGWTQIIGSSLKDFVETGNIKQIIEVNAPALKVWDILLKPEFTSQWASTFGEGVYVETDWSSGSEVNWKDKEGNTGAKGIVEINDKPRLLKVRFFDDVNSSKQEPLGEYVETYTLTEEGGKTTIINESGPLAVKYISMHGPLWTKALEKMKELAEK